MCGEDPDYSKRDLWEAIEQGEEIEWTAHVQVMDQFGLNVYDVLRHRSLAITRDALDALVARLDRPIKPDRAKWSAPQTTPDAAEVLDWTSRGHLREVDKERKKEDVFKRRAAKKAGARV